jgi:NAD-dependent SIR2 family protein deacetylase
MSTDLSKKIDTLAQWIYESKHLVVFTGAGLSTESGLSDFRGPDGLWTRKEKGLPVESINFAGATPNAGHIAIYELQQLGKLEFLISQNVDNLHLKSGIRPEILAELHGNITKVRCKKCDFLMDHFEDIAVCPLCGGELAPSVVDFGQSLPEKDLKEAYAHSGKADLFIVAGSSLVVYPAADMPSVALRAGARLVIINRGKTPLDEYAHLLFDEGTGDILTATVEKLRKLMHT